MVTFTGTLRRENPSETYTKKGSPLIGKNPERSVEDGFLHM